MHGDPRNARPITAALHLEATPAVSELGRVVLVESGLELCRQWLSIGSSPQTVLKSVRAFWSAKDNSFSSNSIKSVITVV